MESVTYDNACFILALSFHLHPLHCRYPIADREEDVFFPRDALGPQEETEEGIRWVSNGTETSSKEDDMRGHGVVMIIYHMIVGRVTPGDIRGEDLVGGVDSDLISMETGAFQDLTNTGGIQTGIIHDPINTGDIRTGIIHGLTNMEDIQTKVVYNPIHTAIMAAETSVHRNSSVDTVVAVEIV